MYSRFFTVIFVALATKTTEEDENLDFYLPMVHHLDCIDVKEICANLFDESDKSKISIDKDESVITSKHQLNSQSSNFCEDSNNDSPYIRTNSDSELPNKRQKLSDDIFEDFLGLLDGKDTDEKSGGNLTSYVPLLNPGLLADSKKPDSIQVKPANETKIRDSIPKTPDFPFDRLENITQPESKKLYDEMREKYDISSLSTGISNPKMLEQNYDISSYRVYKPKSHISGLDSRIPGKQMLDQKKGGEYSVKQQIKLILNDDIDVTAYQTVLENQNSVPEDSHQYDYKPQPENLQNIAYKPSEFFGIKGGSEPGHSNFRQSQPVLDHVYPSTSGQSNIVPNIQFVSQRAKIHHQDSQSSSEEGKTPLKKNTGSEINGPEVSKVALSEDYFTEYKQIESKLTDIFVKKPYLMKEMNNIDSNNAEILGFLDLFSAKDGYNSQRPDLANQFRWLFPENPPNDGDSTSQKSTSINQFQRQSSLRQTDYNDFILQKPDPIDQFKRQLSLDPSGLPLTSDFEGPLMNLKHDQLRILYDTNNNESVVTDPKSFQEKHAFDFGHNDSLQNDEKSVSVISKFCQGFIERAEISQNDTFPYSETSCCTNNTHRTNPQKVSSRKRSISSSVLPFQKNSIENAGSYFQKGPLIQEYYQPSNYLNHTKVSKGNHRSTPQTRFSMQEYHQLPSCPIYTEVPMDNQSITQTMFYGPKICQPSNNAIQDQQSTQSRQMFRDSSYDPSLDEAIINELSNKTLKYSIQNDLPQKNPLGYASGGTESGPNPFSCAINPYSINKKGFANTIRHECHENQKPITSQPMNMWKLNADYQGVDQNEGGFGRPHHSHRAQMKVLDIETRPRAFGPYMTESTPNSQGLVESDVMINTVGTARVDCGQIAEGLVAMDAFHGTQETTRFNTGQHAKGFISSRNGQSIRESIVHNTGSDDWSNFRSNDGQNISDKMGHSTVQNTFNTFWPNTNQYIQESTGYNNGENNSRSFELNANHEAQESRGHVASHHRISTSFSLNTSQHYIQESENSNGYHEYFDDLREFSQENVEYVLQQIKELESPGIEGDFIISTDEMNSNSLKECIGPQNNEPNEQDLGFISYKLKSSSSKIQNTDTELLKSINGASIKISDRYPARLPRTVANNQEQVSTMDVHLDAFNTFTHQKDGPASYDSYQKKLLSNECVSQSSLFDFDSQKNTNTVQCDYKIGVSEELPEGPRNSSGNNENISMIPSESALNDNPKSVEIIWASHEKSIFTDHLKASEVVLPSNQKGFCESILTENAEFVQIIPPSQEKNPSQYSLKKSGEGILSTYKIDPMNATTTDNLKAAKVISTHPESKVIQFKMAEKTTSPSIDSRRSIQRHLECLNLPKKNNRKSGTMQRHIYSLIRQSTPFDAQKNGMSSCSTAIVKRNIKPSRITREMHQPFFKSIKALIRDMHHNKKPQYKNTHTVHRNRNKNILSTESITKNILKGSELGRECTNGERLLRPKCQDLGNKRELEGSKKLNPNEISNQKQSDSDEVIFSFKKHSENIEQQNRKMLEKNLPETSESGNQDIWVSTDQNVLNKHDPVNADRLRDMETLGYEDQTASGEGGGHICVNYEKDDGIEISEIHSETQKSKKDPQEQLKIVKHCPKKKGCLECINGNPSENSVVWNSLHSSTVNSFNDADSNTNQSQLMPDEYSQKVKNKDQVGFCLIQSPRQLICEMFAINEAEKRQTCQNSSSNNQNLKIRGRPFLTVEGPKSLSHVKDSLHVETSTGRSGLSTSPQKDRSQLGCSYINCVPDGSGFFYRGGIKPFCENLSTLHKSQMGNVDREKLPTMEDHSISAQRPLNCEKHQENCTNQETRLLNDSIKPTVSKTFLEPYLKKSTSVEPSNKASTDLQKLVLKAFIEEILACTTSNRKKSESGVFLSEKNKSLYEDQDSTSYSKEKEILASLYGDQSFLSENQSLENALLLGSSERPISQEQNQNLQSGLSSDVHPNIISEKLNQEGKYAISLDPDQSSAVLDTQEADSEISEIFLTGNREKNPKESSTTNSKSVNYQKLPTDTTFYFKKSSKNISRDYDPLIQICTCFGKFHINNEQNQTKRECIYDDMIVMNKLNTNLTKDIQSFDLELDNAKLLKRGEMLRREPVSYRTHLTGKKRTSPRNKISQDTNLVNNTNESQKKFLDDKKRQGLLTSEFSKNDKDRIDMDPLVILTKSELPLILNTLAFPSKDMKKQDQFTLSGSGFRDVVKCPDIFDKKHFLTSNICDKHSEQFLQNHVERCFDESNDYYHEYSSIDFLKKVESHNMETFQNDIISVLKLIKFPEKDVESPNALHQDTISENQGEKNREKIDVFESICSKVEKYLDTVLKNHIIVDISFLIRFCAKMCSLVQKQDFLKEVHPNPLFFNRANKHELQFKTNSVIFEILPESIFLNYDSWYSQSRETNSHDFILQRCFLRLAESMVSKKIGFEKAISTKDLQYFIVLRFIVRRIFYRAFSYMFDPSFVHEILKLNQQELQNSLQIFDFYQKHFGSENELAEAIHLLGNNIYGLLILTCYMTSSQSDLYSLFHPNLACSEFNACNFDFFGAQNGNLFCYTNFFMKLRMLPTYMYEQDSSTRNRLMLVYLKTCQSTSDGDPFSRKCSVFYKELEKSYLLKFVQFGRNLSSYSI